MEYDRRVVPLFRHPGGLGGEVPIPAGSVALAGRPTPDADSAVGTPWFPIDPESDTQPIPAIRLTTDPASVLVAGPVAVSAQQPARGSAAGRPAGGWQLLRAGLVVTLALAIAIALTLALAVAVSGHSGTGGAATQASGRAAGAGPAGLGRRA